MLSLEAGWVGSVNTPKDLIHRGLHQTHAWVSERLYHVYSQRQNELAVWWAITGAPASCSPVNVWPWLPSVSQGCLTSLTQQHMLCGHLQRAQAMRNLLQVQYCWLLTLLGWHRLGKPRGDYKTPFTWGISRHFANIESLISPSAPLKLAGIIGGAKERATAAALWL